jgi:hypothetical protein
VPGLTAGLALAPVSSSRQLLVIGLGSSTEPTLLPSALLASLSTTAEPQIVQLGPYSIYRCLGLIPRRGTPIESAYAMATIGGTLPAGCVTGTSSARFASTCGKVLSTARLTSVAELPLGSNAVYAQALGEVIAKLDTLTAAPASRLRGSPRAAVEATVARDLASAYGQAAAAVAKLSRESESASAAGHPLQAALQMCAGAYAALAKAAATENTRGYATAQASLAHASAAVSAAFAQLREQGFDVT